MNILNVFFTKLRAEKVHVFVYLVNGIKLSGFVEEFDDNAILLRNSKTLQLVLKPAISTVTPDAAFEMDA